MNMFAYDSFEMTHLALTPARALFDLAWMTFKNDFNPLVHTLIGRNLAASAELFGRMTRRYSKPAFNLDTTVVNGERVGVAEEIVWERPFCGILHFKRDLAPTQKPQPRLLIVAPMSGHYATLLRNTVETFLRTHDVYITDWADARLVPHAAGRFDLDDYIDYVIEMCELLSRAQCTPFHILAVCQPSVPVLAAVARMEAEGSRHVPASMTLIGGPIDSRRSPTAVDKFAEEHGTDWFRKNCIHTAPFNCPGVGREVYPGFLQLSGFMAMNFKRHVSAHLKMFNHLVVGDGEAAEKHRRFYDEYLAVMDLTAEFYLQTIDTVFARHSPTQRRDDAPRQEGRPYDDQARRFDDGRRRRGRYHGNRTDLRRPGALRQYSRAKACALSAKGRRTLWHIQWLTLSHRNRAADTRFPRPFRSSAQ